MPAADADPPAAADREGDGRPDDAAAVADHGAPDGPGGPAHPGARHPDPEAVAHPEALGHLEPDPRGRAPGHEVAGRDPGRVPHGHATQHRDRAPGP